MDADILIIDEALAVGDAFFTQKCMRFLRNFMKSGTTLFVSHDMGAVVNLCSRAVLLNHGQVVEIGAPKDVTQHYFATQYESDQEVVGVQTDETNMSVGQVQSPGEYRDMREAMINASTLRNDIEVFQFEPDQAGFGTGDAKIISVQLLDQGGLALSWVVGGEAVILDIRCLAHKDILRPIVGFLFKDRLGQMLFGDNSFLVYQFSPQPVTQGCELAARFEFRLPMLPVGDYSIAVAIADGTYDDHVVHHWKEDCLITKVQRSPIYRGLVNWASCATL